MALQTSELRDWTIYKITSPTCRVYVGKTYNFKGRLSNYRHKAGNAHQQPILYNSLLKYGLDAHKVEVIEQFNSNLSWANGKEIFWIRSEMSNINKWRDREGMNLTNGGEGAPGHRWTEERKKKFISQRKGKPMSEEQKQKLRNYYVVNEAPKPFLGKNHTDESKKKLSLSHIGLKHPNRKSPPPISDETRVKLSLARKGKKTTQLWTSEQRKVVGDSKRGNTYMKGKKLSEEAKNKIRNARLKYSKPILQFDLHGSYINEFSGLRVASPAVGISESSIREILNGITKNPKTFFFKYK